MARMTNAQFADENARLRAACEDLERQLHEVKDAHATKVAQCNKLFAQREELAQQLRGGAPLRAQAASQPKPDARDYTDYGTYCGAARAWCRANNRPVSYKSREQFNDAHAGSEA